MLPRILKLAAAICVGTACLTGPVPLTTGYAHAAKGNAAQAAELRGPLLVVTQHPGAEALVELANDVGNAIGCGHLPRLGVASGV